MRLILLTFGFIFLSSCASTGNQKSEGSFSLKEILKLVPGKSDQGSVQLMLGSADVVMQVPDSDDIAWIFRDKKTGHQKLSLVFNNQKKLQSVLWFVNENEPEIELEISKNRFPNSKFVVQDAAWDNSHSAPREQVFVDEKKGVAITFRKNRQDVESIAWYHPNIDPSEGRKPANRHE